jgi:predicted SAM-dependent methyltransferase
LALGKKLVGRAMTALWPDDLVYQVKGETRASIRHFRTWLFERAKFRGQRELRLNIGCGSNVAHGWVNIDLWGPPGIYRWDCRRGIPFDSEAVKAIFAEHVFEHFTPAVGAQFLSECYRCLEPGGVVRVVVPDAGKYLRFYQGDWRAVVAARPLKEENGKYRDFWLEDLYETKMEFINAIFRQGTEHKYAYDAETLIAKFREAGFAKVHERAYGETAIDGALLDTAARQTDSLYVEAIKG